jgi:hypothetical protein
MRCVPFEIDEEATEKISNCSEVVAEFFRSSAPAAQFLISSPWFRDCHRAPLGLPTC